MRTTIQEQALIHREDDDIKAKERRLLMSDRTSAKATNGLRRRVIDHYLDLLSSLVVMDALEKEVPARRIHDAQEWRLFYITCDKYGALIVQEHRAFPNMFKNDFGHNHIGG